MGWFKDLFKDLFKVDPWFKNSMPVEGVGLNPPPPLYPSYDLPRCEICGEVSKTQSFVCECCGKVICISHTYHQIPVSRFHTHEEGLTSESTVIYPAMCLECTLKYRGGDSEENNESGVNK